MAKPLDKLLPQTPDEGPPLPRILNLRWPKFLRQWREKGEKELERIASEITKGIHTPFR